MIALKFLAAGAVAPFTGFRWPVPGAWVRAPSPGRAELWIHACRPGDLPYWLDEELWRVELEEPVRATRYQIASPSGRLVARVEGWDARLARAYSEACALRARDLALPHLAHGPREALADARDLESLAAASAAAARAGGAVAAYVADAVRNARDVGPATTSYIAAVIASATGGGLDAFEAERAWQARWLADRLGLAAG